VRTKTILLAAVLAVVAAACGGGDDEGAIPTLQWYVFGEPSGSFAAARDRCNEAAEGRYRIDESTLPASADQQREQLVRRLAAADVDIDIIGMDVIWTAEFAEAGWILPLADETAAAVSEGALSGPLESATYRDQLWVAPFTSNTQLLWYRGDLVDEAPETWSEMIEMAAELPEANRIQVQGNRYEGLTVWFNTLVASAGGEIITGDGDDQEVGLQEEPTIEALTVLRDLATSPAADPSLSVSNEDTGRLAFEAGTSAFMVNWPFVYPSAADNAPAIHEDMQWARYPSVVAGEPSRPPLGGINLGVGAFSDHPEFAMEAVECLVAPENQLQAAIDGGLPPTNEALYDDPALQEEYPFADVIRESLEDAAPRPVTPAYNDVSLATFKTIHPPRDIDPQAALEELRDKIEQAQTSGGLL
jgi:multiple sugar transport system substrate-binding protein